MSEKSKLYVFEKKEVALIFVFMILIAITAFMLGVKMGKSYSYQSSGLTEADRKKVELLSAQEENVNKVLESEKSQQAPADKQQDQLREQMHQKLQDKIREGLKEKPGSSSGGQQEQRGGSSSSMGGNSSSDIIQDYQQQKGPSASSSSSKSPSEASKIASQEQRRKKKASAEQEKAYKGKYTIQLGSYRGRKDAEEFARGFTIRGYDPIINEVEIPGRGTWYRVSLGVFNSSTEAKEYIKKEEELFQGQDYVIGRFD